MVWKADFKICPMGLKGTVLYFEKSLFFKEQIDQQIKDKSDKKEILKFYLKGSLQLFNV